MEKVKKVRVELMGSLAATGKGHATDTAVMLGLMGESPSQTDTSRTAQYIEQIQTQKRLRLDGLWPIEFDPQQDIVFSPQKVDPLHTNAMRFEAFDSHDELLLGQKIYSSGGGFIETEAQMQATRGAHHQSLQSSQPPLPCAYTSAEGLLAWCRKKQCSIASVIRSNEQVWRGNEEIDAALDTIADLMQACVQRGLSASGLLPGPLKIKRRAARMASKLAQATQNDPLAAIDWVNVFAIAASEENACGGRVVTAPTNGACGVVPAVLMYLKKFQPEVTDKQIRDYLLVAGAIGALYKRNASISGAEVGCQGEIGVACSMAAAGLAAALGGSPEQIENAAEIGMEHHLGLTCDPVAGLVQVPCIERNAAAASNAVNAARMALLGDGEHFVSLDQVIKTMMDTGRDMQSKYKETSLGGLAVCMVEC